MILDLLKVRSYRFGVLSVLVCINSSLKKGASFIVDTILIRRIRNIENLHGIEVFQTSLIWPGTGICLPGIGIFIHDAIPESARKRIIQHEYGHYLDYKIGDAGDQKRFLGSHLLGFYLKIGLPSLLNLMWGINKIPAFSGDHRRFWTETRANRLANSHFGETLAEDFDRYFPTAQT